MKPDWMLDVIRDLADVAKINGLTETAEILDVTEKIFQSELSGGQTNTSNNVAMLFPAEKEKQATMQGHE